MLQFLWTALIYLQVKKTTEIIGRNVKNPIMKATKRSRASFVISWKIPIIKEKRFWKNLIWCKHQSISIRVKSLRNYFALFLEKRWDKLLAKSEGPYQSHVIWYIRKVNISSVILSSSLEARIGTFELKLECKSISFGQM